MRIDGLELRAFGPFTGRVLDLSQGQEGLHVVFGPNEAGKSSALRALEQFFFGIPPKSDDNFLHKYPAMRIGAAIRPRTGEVFRAVRRKGNKSTLRDGEDGEPVAEEQLAALLGGIDAQTFTTMFGIDHERLLAGGEEIVRGGGQVGQTLFAAGAGISSLQAICDRFESAAGELFKPAAKNPVINDQLRRWREADKAFRDALLPAKEWQDRQRDLDGALERLEAIDRDLHQFRSQHRRGQRLLQALKYVPRRKAVLERLAALGAVTVLPPVFTERRLDAEKRLLLAESQEEKARREIARLEADLSGVAVPEGVIESAPQIEEANRKVGAYVQALQDIPKREAERDENLLQADHALRAFRPGVSLEMVESLRLSDAQKECIAALGLEHQATLRAPQLAEQDLREAETQLEEAREELQELAGGQADAGPLRDLLRRHMEYGDLERERAGLQAEETGKAERARAALARLGMGHLELDAFERQSVPDASSIELFHEAWEEARSRADQIERDRRQHASQRQAIDRQLDELQLQGDVPTEADLAEARRIRESGWKLVRAAWKEGRVAPEPLEAFLADLAVPRDIDLAEAYARAVERTDELADRLFHEVERVHRQASLMADRNAADRELARLAEEAATVQAERSALESRWSAIWASSGVVPRSPREMLAWPGRHRELLQDLASLRATQAASAQLAGRIQAARDEIRTCLSGCGEAAPADETLVALRERCQRLVQQLADQAARRTAIQKNVDRLAKAARQAGSKLEQAREQWQAWRERWAEAVEPIGLPADAAPTAANQALATLDRLFGWLQQVGDKRERIAEMAEMCQGFERALRTLLERLAPELAGLSAEEQVKRLNGVLQDARARHHQREQLRGELGRHQDDARAAQRDAENARAELQTLCREAGCAAAGELKEAERRSSEARELLAERDRLEETLHEIGAGIALEDLVREAEPSDPDALQAELDATGLQIEQREAERRELDACRGRLTAELKQLELGMPAADAAELAGSILAEMEGKAWEYARLRLASAVLRMGIERYRQQNQDPILTRAGELFARMTAGSFCGLRTDSDENGNPVLMGDRGNGQEAVASAGMSEGTRYQLYLALRIASLEHYLEHREPVPLVVDDILISFDDERSAAALDVLAELSRKTQVIFFTHHRHLVEIAERRLPGEVLFCHKL